ncbi:MAG: D-alanyl-D-alanine carboxypeptidase family protein [Oscillospiraceae bacterium]
MKKLRFIAFFVTLTILCCSLSSLGAFAAYDVDFEVASKGAYLVNTDTNTVVYEKNKDEKLYPASLTKIMTTLLALETISDLENTVITAPAYVYNEFAGLSVSNADIKQREEVRAIDLLYATMLPSACEAASIVADYISGGSIPKFVEQMNQKAKELGAVNTHFVNAHGLHDPEQYTTPYDMYLIVKHALTIPKFEEISTTVSYEMPATNKHASPRTIVHTNSMTSKVRGGPLYYYQYVKGIKTGTTPEAGSNLVSMASKDGYNYLLVTMGAPLLDENGNKYNRTFSYLDAKNLYEWAFNTFKLKTIVQSGQTFGEMKIKLSSKQDFVTLKANKDVNLLLPNNVDQTNLLFEKTLYENVNAPINAEQTLGTMDIKLKNETIATIDLVASESVGRNPVLYAWDLIKRFFKSFWVKLISILLLIIIILYIVYAVLYNKKRRNKNKISKRYKSPYSNYHNR